MPVNLSLLSVEEKNKIEIDKQASYLVWQLKLVKIAPNEILAQKDKLKNEHEKAWFEQSVEKYKRVMGVT